MRTGRCQFRNMDGIFRPVGDDFRFLHLMGDSVYGFGVDDASMFPLHVCTQQSQMCEFWNFGITPIIQGLVHISWLRNAASEKYQESLKNTNRQFLSWKGKFQKASSHDIGENVECIDSTMGSDIRLQSLVLLLQMPLIYLIL